MKKNKKIEMKSSQPNIISVDGEEYILEKETSKKIDGILHGDKFIFKPYKKKEFIKDLNLIVTALAKKTTKKELIKEILKKVEYKSIKQLASRIRNKKTITKQHGCLGFKVGNAYIQLID
jgi:hypothetical protein